MGYRYRFGLAEGETLVDLAIDPLRSALECAGSPRALVTQHCHAECAVMPCEPGDTIGASRNRYLPPRLCRVWGLITCLIFVRLPVAAPAFIAPDHRQRSDLSC